MDLCQYCSLKFENSNILNIHLSLVHPKESYFYEKRNMIEGIKSDRNDKNKIEGKDEQFLNAPSFGVCFRFLVFKRLGHETKTFLKRNVCLTDGGPEGFSRPSTAPLAAAP